MITTFAASGAGTGTVANAINTAGTIAGFYYDTSLAFHGFMRTSSGTITTLDVPGAGTGEGSGTVANGINTAGDIVGYFLADNGPYHGFLLTP